MAPERRGIPTPEEARPMLRRFLDGDDALPEGFHEGLAMPDYVMAPQVSSSLLRTIPTDRGDIPARALVSLLTGPKVTDALLDGDAIHAAVLEPDRFESDYVVAGQCKATKGDGSRCEYPGKVLHKDKGWLCGVHSKSMDPEDEQPILKTISPDQHEMCLGIRDSLLVHHDRTRKLLADIRGEVELTGSWRDPTTGLMMKLRGDRVLDSLGVNLDLKSTEDASEWEFRKHVWNYRYDLQQGHYRRGFQELGRDIRTHVLIAVEKRPPYLAATYELDDDVVWATAKEARQLSEQLAECLETNHWPTYPDKVRKITLPPWGWKALNRRGIDPNARHGAGNGPAPRTIITQGV